MERTAKVGAIDDPVWNGGVDMEVKWNRLHRRRRVGAIVLLSLVGLGFALVPVVSAFSRKEYGTFAIWKVPTRIEFCGRTYNQVPGTEVGTPAGFTASYRAPRAHWEEVDRTFSLRPIYAIVPASHPNSSVCAFILFVSAGSRRWWTYTLSGGP